MTPAPAEQDGALETILIVDDEDVVRDIVRRTLERAGYHVLASGSGREALEQLQEHAGDVSAVLMDVTMPDMSGEETLSRLRQIRIDVPVVLSSGYARPHFLEESTSPGRVAWLQKPYRPHVLLQTIRRMLDS